VEGGLSLTVGTLSDPQTSDNNDGKQLSGRFGVRPTPGLSIGVSGASGEFVDEEYQALLPEPARSETYRQQALGVDGEYARGHVVVRGEIVSSHWDTPFLNGDPTLRLHALGTSIETRIALTPRWSVAVRGDRLGFSEVETATGANVTWDANVKRVEGAVGYMLRRNVRLKASYQYNWRNGGRIREAPLAGAQLLYWF
jgi:hypothetical protein